MSIFGLTSKILDISRLLEYLKYMFLQPKQKQLTRATAGFLTVWLSGVVFLFCCQMPSAQASSEEIKSCPMAKAHHSCAKSKSENKAASIEAEQSALECCRMLPLVFDKARKIEKVQNVEQAASIVKISEPKFYLAKKEFTHPKIFNSLVLSRENTHLKNCVFRI